MKSDNNFENTPHMHRQDIQILEQSALASVGSAVYVFQKIHTLMLKSRRDSNIYMYYVLGSGTLSVLHLLSIVNSNLTLGTCQWLEIS